MSEKVVVKLSHREQLWLKCYLDQSNPDTFFRGVASVMAAGYKPGNPHAAATQGTKNKMKCLPLIEKWIDDVGMSEAELKRRLMEGLEARETKFFAYQGSVCEVRDVIPWGVRHDFLKLAMQSKGMLITRAELTGKNGQPIQGEVDHFVKFPSGPMTIEEWEKQCADADKARADAEANNSDTDSDGDSVGTAARPAG
jgi:hypothetical protein